LLRRWLEHEKRDFEPALLLDALNARIEDPDFKIGPSYLMKPGVFRDGGLERTWRTKILPLLEEHHYGEGVDVERRYGLSTLRRVIRGQSTDVPAEQITAEALDSYGRDAFAAASDPVADL
jgi:5-methylcytosine-specific restriction protein B